MKKKERLMIRDSTVVLTEYMKWVRNNSNSRPLRTFGITIKQKANSILSL